LRKLKEFENEIENLGNLINEIIKKDIFIKIELENNIISYELKKKSISENEAFMLKPNSIKTGTSILKNN